MVLRLSSEIEQVLHGNVQEYSANDLGSKTGLYEFGGFHICASSCLTVSNRPLTYLLLLSYFSTYMCVFKNIFLHYNLFSNHVILFVLFRIFLLVDGVWKDQLMVNHQSFISSLLNMF